MSVNIVSLVYKINVKLYLNETTFFTNHSLCAVVIPINHDSNLDQYWPESDSSFLNHSNIEFLRSLAYRYNIKGC